MSRPTPSYLLPLVLLGCLGEVPPEVDHAVYRYGTDVELRDRLIRDGRMFDDLGGTLVGARNDELARIHGVPMQDVADPEAGQALWVVGGHAHDPAVLDLTARGLEVWSDPDAHVALMVVDADAPEPGFRCHGAVRRVRTQSLRPSDATAQRVRSQLTPAVPSIVQMLGQISLPAMQDDVDTLVSYGTRRHGLPGEFAAQTLLEQRFSALGLDVEVLDYDGGADVVCGVLPGEVDPDRLVIVGAHYDSVNWQGSSTSIAPGADDDASGTAAVLELARVLSAQPGFEHTLRFCGWSGEELGLLGSDAEASRLAAAGADVIGMLQLDMIGYTPQGSARQVEFILNDTTPTLTAFSRDVFATYVPSLPTSEGFLGAGSSDHASFFARGFPAAWPFEDDGGGSPAIHTSQDVVGVSINDWVKAEGITKGTLATLAELARPLSVSLEHAPLPHTTDDVGPYTLSVEAISRTQASVDAVDLRWRLSGTSSWTTVAMTPSTGDTWTAALPAPTSPARVEYAFDATDSDGALASLPALDLQGDGVFEFAVGARTTRYSWDFEAASDEGWTHAALATQDDWQRGRPQGKGTDPIRAARGDLAWGNDLGPTGWDGDYQANVDNYLESPPLDLTGATGLRLRFARWLAVEKGQYDQARVMVDGATAWANPFATDVLDTSWNVQDLDISALADDRSGVRLRWSLTSDGGLEYGGWNLDDVSVYSFLASDTLGSLRLLGPASAQIGDQVTLRLVGLPPNASWSLVVSASDAGSTALGQPLEVGTPHRVVTSGMADGQGRGQTTFTVPPAAAGGTWHFEAGTVAGGLRTTNLHTLQVP